MTLTTSKIFLDSSVFIEGAKKTAPGFFEAVTKPTTLQGFISDIVCSETWYLFLGLMGGASPLALKQRTAIHGVIAADEEAFAFFRQYTVLQGSLQIVETALRMMKKYNLLPNDALILSTCITHKVFFLASHDSDFEIACAGEGISLVTPENYLDRLPA